jgi:hypothetical protein
MTTLLITPRQVTLMRYAYLSTSEVADDNRAYAAISDSLRVARLTNYRSILLLMIAIVLRRNCAIACRSPMRIDQSRQQQPGSRH